MCWIWNRVARYRRRFTGDAGDWRGIGVVVIGIVVAIFVAVLGGSAGANTVKPAPPKSRQQTLRRAPTPGSRTQVAPPAAGEDPDSGRDADRRGAAAAGAQGGRRLPDSTLAVKGLTNAPQYAIGDQPKFMMVVTNIGLVACKRDVGAAVLAAYVYSLDNKRLWSNLDCAPSNETLVKTFTPGEQVTTAVTWTGMGSAPHCPLPRPAIGPGTYNLVVQLGNLRSLTVPFILACRRYRRGRAAWPAARFAPAPPARAVGPVLSPGSPER